MSITISGEDRDVLYHEIVARLTGIDAVLLAVARGDWDSAQTVGQNFSDLLQFVCSDLGWGPKRKDLFTLTTPPEILRRVAEALHEGADQDRRYHERDRDEAAEDAAEAKQRLETCDRILSSLKTCVHS